MDREPKPAPFPVGATVRYVRPGDPLRTGRVARIVETVPGRRGTLRMVDLHDGDEPFPDVTRDGRSVGDFGDSGPWCITKGQRVHMRIAIWPDAVDDWERVS